MSCNDPTIRHLKRYGYNVLRLPRADALPLEILSRRGSELTRLGRLGDILANESIGLPAIQLGAPGISISGKQTARMDIGLGVTMLGTILAAMGGDVGVKAQYRQARSIALSYENVAEEKVDLTRLDTFLSSAVFREVGNTILELLEADKIYVFSSVLRAKEFGIAAYDESGTAIKLDVPVVQAMIGTHLEVSTAASNESKLVYKGAQELTFAFKAIQLVYEDGAFRRFRPASAGSVVAASVAPIDDEDAPLATDSALIQVSGF